MAITLKKVIAPDSLRGIGSIARGVEPHKLVSAGHSAELISAALGGQAFSAGRTNGRLAFCVLTAGAYYVYVHRDYKAYRRFFRMFFQGVPSLCDVDHVLSRNLAKQIGVPYLLLAAVPKSVNRSHGHAERLGLAQRRGIFLGKTFPLDERMFHKILSRRIGAHRFASDPCHGYKPGSGHTFGLTLKQRGIWNLAFRVDAVDAGRAPGVALRPIVRSTQVRGAA